MRLLASILRAPATITLVLLILTLIIGASVSDSFLHAEYLLDKTSIDVPIGFLALALTFVIISGSIDLSVASGSVLTAVASAMAFRAGLPMWATIPFALAFGTTLGLFNGLLITKLKLPSLVVTLGTLALFRGLAQVLIKESSIWTFPDWFKGIDYLKAGIVPTPLILLLTAACIAGFVLRCTTFGRRVYAIGTNEPAALFSGVNVDGNKLIVFAISGFAMGIAALMLMSMRPVDYKQLRSGELLAITAVVLGGTSIFGGKGGIVGTVLAILLLVAVGSAMGIKNVRAENKLAVIGALLIGAVLLTDLANRLFVAKRSKSPPVTLGATHA
jgi:rhamnose transport system permease protein